MQILCLATRSLLPSARVMARSLARQHPDWPLEVVLIGKAPDHGLGDSVTVRDAGEELGIDIPTAIASYEESELIALLVPQLLLERSRPGRPTLHLPASAWVLDELTPLVEALASSSVMLAPRSSGDPPADGLEPSPRQLEAAGRVCDDLIAVDGSETSAAFLRWWSGRLHGALGSLDGSEPGDRVEDRHWLRRMLELAPARFLAATLDDPGCNLSVWNLHEHRLARSGGRVLVDNRYRLRLMNLAGFEPTRPYRLAPASSRIRVSKDPVLKELSVGYAQELEQAGWSDANGRLGIGRPLADGTVFDETMWRLHAQARSLGEDFGDLFSAGGTASFLAWLNGPAPHGARHGINRYVFHRVARERPDVPLAYPDLDGNDGREYVAWCWMFGRAEIGLPEKFLPPAPPHVASALDLAAASAPLAPWPAGPDGRDRPRAVDGVTADAAHAPGASRDTAAAAGPIGVRVSGYLAHTLGLGSAARGYAQALQAAGVAVTTVSVPLEHLELPDQLAQEYGRHAFDDVVHDGGHGFEIICVNADELPRFVQGLGEDYFQGPRIGIWGWETNSIPVRWQKAFSLVDEIWVYSRFMAENLGAVAPVPVVALPPPVVAAAPAAERVRLGVPDGFMFLYLFDYLSTIQRKNPVGLIEAFKRAFEPGEGPRLLVKTINAPLRPLAEEEVLWAVGDRQDIRLVDCSLTAAQKDALMAECDCYVSLHRSEGFGLTMAEAMALGKPVIATGYSGNVDFMTAQNSFLVDYALTRVGPDCEIYPAEGIWAEPSVEQASGLMRRIWLDPKEARAVGERARADVARALSPEVTGRQMRERLQLLAALDVPPGAMPAGAPARPG